MFSRVSSRSVSADAASGLSRATHQGSCEIPRMSVCTCYGDMAFVGLGRESIAHLAGRIGVFGISSISKHKLTAVVKGEPRPYDHDTLLSQGCQSLPKMQMLLHIL